MIGSLEPAGAQWPEQHMANRQKLEGLWTQVCKPPVPAGAENEMQLVVLESIENKKGLLDGADVEKLHSKPRVEQDIQRSINSACLVSSCTCKIDL